MTHTAPKQRRPFAAVEDMNMRTRIKPGDPDSNLWCSYYPNKAAVRIQELSQENATIRAENKRLREALSVFCEEFELHAKRNGNHVNSWFYATARAALAGKGE